MKEVWISFRSGECTDDFSAKTTTKFFPRTCCAKDKKHGRRLSKEEIRCTEMICLCSKTFCCYDSQSDRVKFGSRGLKKRTLEDCGDGPSSKIAKIWKRLLK